jgi:DNA-binding response OmpR family regulator
MARRARILVVESDGPAETLLAGALRHSGHEISVAQNERHALRQAQYDGFDLVILSAALPELGGFELCRRLREKSTVPIIMIGPRQSEYDKVEGLESGADDYMTRPVSARELLSRIRAILRRAELAGPALGNRPVVSLHGLTIDFDSHVVRTDDGTISLTYVEFEILAALIRNPGRAFTRTELLEDVWGDSAYRDRRTIDVHMRHLREKVERDPAHPTMLLTVRGLGYRLRGTEEAHLAGRS